MLTLVSPHHLPCGLGLLVVAVLSACGSPASVARNSDAQLATTAAHAPITDLSGTTGSTTPISGLGIDVGDDTVVIATVAATPASVLHPKVEPTTAPVTVPAETVPPVTASVKRVPVSLQADTLFDADSATLQTAADDELAGVIAGVGPIERITIIGFTDVRGTPEHNLALSEQRAAAVAAWFMARGVDPARLSAIGRGEQEATPDGTPEQMAADRRVDIVVLTS